MMPVPFNNMLCSLSSTDFSVEVIQRHVAGCR